MIPKDQCKDRHLYRIHSRNLALGVFRAESGGFTGIREKAGNVYLFEEYHWDNGPPHGTVRPEEELSEVLPADILNQEGLGSFCQTCGVRCNYVKWPEGGEREIELPDGYKMKVPGEWQHENEAPTSTCTEPRPAYHSNQALFAWLQQMEAKYLKT